MIRTLTINSYRNTRPCTLHFDPQLTVILGRNGTGRSEILRMIYLALANNRSTWVRDDRRIVAVPFDVVVSHDDDEADVATRDDCLDSSHYSGAGEFVDYALQSGEQHIITTQNPSLIDVIPIDDEAQLQRRIILTAREGDEFVWRNPTADEAARVARSLAAGIQHVSEILRAEGLW